jgi:hypothetical protein
LFGAGDGGRGEESGEEVEGGLVHGGSPVERVEWWNSVAEGEAEGGGAAK